jgi:predicted nucleotidyltransferase
MEGGELRKAVNFDHHEVHYDVCKRKNKKHKAQLDDVNELKMYFYFFTSVFCTTVWLFCFCKMI